MLHNISLNRKDLDTFALSVCTIVFLSEMMLSDE